MYSNEIAQEIEPSVIALGIAYASTLVGLIWWLAF